MEFDWTRAIDRNREDLLVIVARLFVLTGIGTGRPIVAALARGLRGRVLAILRPAEFATRRLITMAAWRLTVPAGPERAVRDNPGKAGSVSRKPAPTAGDRVPAFPLFDPFKPFCDPWLTEEEIARLENPGDTSWRAMPAPPLPAHEPVGARSLCLRIHSLRNALDDIEGNAMRLARWRASDVEARKPRRSTPLRPGRPPGWRKRPKTAVEEVLKECHSLAHLAFSPPDTS